MDSTRLKAELRSRLLDSRSGLDPHQRLHMDRRICVHLFRLLEERDCLDLSGFFAFRGEPDLSAALEALEQAGRRIWMPVIDGASLRFRLWRPGEPAPPNRFGIPEPAEGPECPPQRLELVLTPLVAFSPTGNRLGMGAGFYDRTFGFLRADPYAGPLLIGVGYSLQEVDSLPVEPWDVPLSGVITERGLRMFRE